MTNFRLRTFADVNPDWTNSLKQRRARNALLESFASPIQQRLLTAAKWLKLPPRTFLYETSAPVNYVYFLDQGVASVTVHMAEGGAVEIGMIGSEGIVAAHALLGSRIMTTSCFMQVGGSGFQVPLQEMAYCFEADSRFRSQVLACVQTQLSVTSQLSACNKLHETKARLARWLLMASDRARVIDLHITQEFLAEMLGSRRTTVALIAGMLQRRGYIENSRGRVRILNREGLESLACECYGLIKAVQEPRPRLKLVGYESLLGQERSHGEQGSEGMNLRPLPAGR